MKKLFLLTFATVTFISYSCKNDDDRFNYYYYSPDEMALLSQDLNLPALPADYNQVLPAYLTVMGGVFSRPAEPSKVELGRVLFYDKNLSKDATISCASCHKQELAFGDDAAVSKGVFERSGERNSIALNSVPSFSGSYDNTGSLLFWDNRAKDVQEQSRASLGNIKEMDMSMPEVVQAVMAQPYYPVLFKKAFGDETITEERVTTAIQSFVHALSSFESKFDEAAEQEYNDDPQNPNFIAKNFSTFTARENLGKQIYLNDCSSCHTQMLTVPFIPSASNGLDALPTDPGVGGITNQAHDHGTFKIPALRNVGLTAPYMHDGRFKTLEEVVEHYSTGIQPHANLHFTLKQPGGEPVKFNYTAEQKQALVAFLHTLSDEKMKTDKRYANPFKQ